MSNYIKNIAFVGVTGNSGSHMVAELLKTGKHTITAVTRSDSSSTPPAGCKVAQVDYNSHSSLVAALTGQDALIITLGVTAPHDTQSKLIRAAADANVPWILPNEWSPDSAHPGLIKDIPMAIGKLPPVREEIKSLGKSSYIAVSTGFWYEWSLAIPAAFGVDFGQRKVTFVDDGRTVINTSTWPQVGRAVAALLSLPVRAEAGVDKDKCLEHFRDGHVYVSSFAVSQKDMFASALKVTGTKEEEWAVEYEGHQERYERGMEAMQAGDRIGFVVAMYTRGFYPDDSAHFEKRLGTQNQLLGLPVEDLDAATKIAMGRASEWAAGH